MIIAALGALVGLAVFFFLFRRQNHRGATGMLTVTEGMIAAPSSTPGSRFFFAEAIPVPLVVADKAGRAIFVNTVAKVAFADGLSAILRHPMLQKQFSDVTSHQASVARLELDVPVRRVLQSRVSAWTLAASSPRMRDETYFVVALDDHTEAAEAQRMQIDFVAYASHELKTPLAAITGLLETIQGPASEDLDAQREFLGIMSRQAARMRRLIDRLLHLSHAQRLEHWRPQTRMHLQEFWMRLREEVRALGQQHSGRVMVEEEVSPLTLLADADQLIQLVLNLVENAFKYAGTDCEVHLQSTVDSRDGLMISVSDNGPGVEARHLPRLTERFYRVIDGASGGTGLGLAIVKHIVDRHGGRIKLTSGEGKGFRCDVWLPTLPERAEPPGSDILR